MFPRLREEAVLALKANEVSPALAFQLSSLLQTALKGQEELQAEEREAQEAVRQDRQWTMLKSIQKLHELLRRGTPADLAAANDIMKELAGYVSNFMTFPTLISQYHDRTPSFVKKANEDLEKVEEKARLMGQMLANLKPGEAVATNETIQVL